MNTYYRRIFTGIALLTALTAGFFLRETLLRYVLQPLAELLWLVWRILASVDQKIYWYLLIVGLFLLVLRMIPDRTVNYPRVHNGSVEKPGRGINYWKHIIQTAEVDIQKEDRLRFELRNLAANLIATQKHCDPNDALVILASGQVEMPEDVQRFLYPEQTTHNNKIMRSLIVLQKRIRQSNRDNRLTIQTGTQATLAWLTNTLENSHGE